MCLYCAVAARYATAKSATNQHANRHQHGMRHPVDRLSGAVVVIVNVTPTFPATLSWVMEYLICLVGTTVSAMGTSSGFTVTSRTVVATMYPLFGGDGANKRGQFTRRALSGDSVSTSSACSTSNTCDTPRITAMPESDVSAIVSTSVLETLNNPGLGTGLHWVFCSSSRHSLCTCRMHYSCFLVNVIECAEQCMSGIGSYVFFDTTCTMVQL